VTENSDQNIDATFTEWRMRRESHATMKRMAVIVGAITGLGWLLFLAKMGQTSEMALRYSTRAQESVGQWTMVLLLMSIGAIVLIVLANQSKNRVSVLAAQLTAALRDRLGGADDGERAKIESQLRELGA